VVRDQLVRVGYAAVAGEVVDVDDDGPVAALDHVEPVQRQFEREAAAQRYSRAAADSSQGWPGAAYEDALPGGEQPLRAALWAFMRPILSPRLVELNKDAFVFDGGVESRVDLDAHRADSDLDDLDLGEDDDAAAA
jgi:hypothetical protein